MMDLQQAKDEYATLKQEADDLEREWRKKRQRVNALRAFIEAYETPILGSQPLDDLFRKVDDMRQSPPKPWHDIPFAPTPRIWMQESNHA